MPSKVLIFDTNPQRKKIIEAAFDSDSFLLAFARDSKEGVAKFEAFKPDFLIANEELEDISGIKIFRDLKKTGKITDSQFVLMVKEDEDTDSVPEKIFFLRKPFKTTDIINLLEEAKMVKDNQSDFDLVEAEMDKVVQNLRKDNDEIMEDITASSSSPPIMKLSADDIVEDNLEPSEELEFIDDLLEANDEELESMIDENENYSSEKLGVKPVPEKSREEELNDLEKELYGSTDEVNELPDEAIFGNDVPDETEAIPDDLLADFNEPSAELETLESLSESDIQEEDIVDESELLAGLTEENPLERIEGGEESEGIILPDEPSSDLYVESDDIIPPEELSSDIFMEGLEAGEQDDFVQPEPEAKETLQEDLLNDDIFGIEAEEDASIDELQSSGEDKTDFDDSDLLNEADISDAEFLAAEEVSHVERSKGLDLDSEEITNEAFEGEKKAPSSSLNYDLMFGENITDEDLKQTEVAQEDLDESLFDKNVEEIKTEEVNQQTQTTLDGLIRTMIGQMVRSEVEKTLKSALPEFSPMLEDYVKEMAPDIIKQVVREEIEKLKEG